MYTLVNVVDGEIMACLKTDAELIRRVEQIVVENGDENISIIGLSDAEEYLEAYSENIILLKDSEVDEFLSKYGTKVQPNEASDYVELMMDNHKCTNWNEEQYYIPEDKYYPEGEDHIYRALAYSLHA